MSCHPRTVTALISLRWLDIMSTCVCVYMCVCVFMYFSDSSSAAAFLKAFINDGVQWAHLDVAGPAMDGSGFGVQLLMDYLQRRAAEQN